MRPIVLFSTCSDRLTPNPLPSASRSNAETARSSSPPSMLADKCGEPWTCRREPGPRPMQGSSMTGAAPSLPPPSCAAANHTRQCQPSLVPVEWNPSTSAERNEPWAHDSQTPTRHVALARASQDWHIIPGVDASLPWQDKMVTARSPCGNGHAAPRPDSATRATATCTSDDPKPSATVSSPRASAKEGMTIASDNSSRRCVHDCRRASAIFRQWPSRRRHLGDDGSTFNNRGIRAKKTKEAARCLPGAS